MNTRASPIASPQGTHLPQLEPDLEDFRTSARISSLVEKTAGEELPIIGRLLGHRRVETNARYAQLARDSVSAVTSMV